MKSPEISPAIDAAALKRHLTRVVLISFVTTFILARIVVLLIMTHRMPVLYLHLGHTHVHHLNYGIFLLSIVGGFLLFRRPEGTLLSLTAVVYGFGLGLTFDEFGMWVHLGGPYWQRASFDAVIIVTAILGLISAAPRLKTFRPRHWTTALLLVAGLICFGLVLKDSMRYATEKLSPYLEQIESGGPE